MKMNHNGNAMTTGAKIDRINLKHAVRMFVKNNVLPGAESKAGYVVAHAEKSGQEYFIARNGRMSRAQVAKIARENAERVLLTEEIYDRLVVVMKV